MENSVALQIAACAAALIGSVALLRHIFRDDPIFYASPSPKHDQFKQQDFLRMPDTKPLFGDLPFLQNIRYRLRDWTTEFMNAAAEKGDFRPLLIKIPFGNPIVLFNDPLSVEHILRTKFHIYDKVTFLMSLIMILPS